VRDKPPYDPTSIVIAYQWAARVIMLAIEMVVPGVAGHWVDGRLGTKALFTLLGFALGAAFALRQLLRIAQQSQRRQVDPDSSDQREEPRP
jgi:uncharacterized membrane protein